MNCERKIYGIAGCLLGMVLLGGCMVGPDPARPSSVGDTARAYVNGPAVAVEQKNEPVMVSPWWQGFGDPVTQVLVEEALAHNTDVAVAAARVMEAEAVLRSTTGARYPQVGLSGGVSRTQSSMIVPPAGRTVMRTTTHELGMNVGWQVDVFGKLRRAEQAAWYDMLSTHASHDAVIHTVIAQVVRLRVQIATLQRRLEIAEANTASWQATTDIVKQRYDQGIASALDLRLAQENLAATKAAEPGIRTALAKSEHALDVLLGQQPGTGEELPRTLSPLPDLKPVPLSVPAALLDRRPDLRSTELAAAAQTARIGVAVADLYPDLSLSAAAGYQSDRLERMIRPDTFVWSLIADASMKVFAGGSLRANVDAAKARAQAAASQYAGAVLNAMREVEDALVTEKNTYEQLDFLRQRYDEAKAAEDLAKERYQRGVEPLLTVLESERRRTQAQNDWVVGQEALWESRVDLYLSLGGDWLEPEPMAGVAWSGDEGVEKAEAATESRP